MKHFHIQTTRGIMMLRYVVALFLISAPALSLSADEPVDSLDFTKWSDAVNVPDPVAISLDNQGRAYVTQTQRRKVQDLDIRANSDWIADDVGLRSVAEKRAFLRKQLDPNLTDPKTKKRVADLNGDGSHDYRDLMMISERIHLVEDTDGDGKADQIQLFADGFNTEVTGIAAGVLWHDGDVYTTIAPDVWKLQDTNHDGKADQREAIATGFGFHIAYAGHDMHGLTVGPDGRIYWTVGDKGINATSPEGRTFFYPNQGGVMRCNPDGSQFEVFAHGLRNVQELAFDDFGNLFGVDNDADQPGESERVVYIAKDMDAGWRCNYQYRKDDYNPWTEERLWQTHFDQQAAYITPPLQYSLNGPAGFAFNPGTALGPSWQRYFFLTGAPDGQQIAFQFQPNGASFEATNEREVGKGTPIVGINFGPDGALYGVDWGGGYPLNQKGAIWKIDSTDHADSDQRREVQILLRSGVGGYDDQGLVEMLLHADQRIRLSAQFELVRRQADETIERVAASGDSLLARVHAIWAIGQRLRSAEPASMGTETLTRLLEDDDAEIRAQAARTIGDLPVFDGRQLIPLLKDPEPRVRFFAAIALGSHGVMGAKERVIAMIAANNGDDLYLRHAGITALASCKNIAALADHPSQAVRLAAVVALRRNEAPTVARFLNDDSELVVAEAARAIHDAVGMAETLEGRNPQQTVCLNSLASMLREPSSSNEVIIRRCINAGFRLGQAEHGLLIAGFAAREDSESVLKLDALDALSQWDDPPILDRVDGRSRREKPTRSLDRKRLEPILSSLLQDEDSRVAAQALATAGALKIEIAESSLVEVVASQNTPAELRAEALTLLSLQGSLRLPESLENALRSNSAELRVLAMKLMTKANPDEASRHVMAALTNSRNQYEKQQAASLLGRLESREADALLAKQLALLVAGRIDPALHLEILEAAESRQSGVPELARLLKELETKRQADSAEDRALAFDECLSGGDADRGKTVFMTNVTAQCVRCHRVGEKGSTVGPDLAGVASRRDRKLLLRSIVAPSADIDAKYRSHTVLLLSGRIENGLLVREDDKSLVLVNAQGKEITIEQEEIEDSFAGKVSIMPDMSKTLSRRDIRDLVAYLTTLKSGKK